MIAVSATVLFVTVTSVALIALMNTDMTHASIQHAVARSFYIAQAGLEEAKIQISEAADPMAYTTPAGGMTVAYGTGRFTYWVDAGPASGCGPGLKTLESLGQVAFLGRTIPVRVRACGVAGTPFLAALFGVSEIQLQGPTSRMYLAPYLVGTPGGGGSLGSFTEINFSDNDVRLNALSEAAIDTLTLRDGSFADYELFGFSERPDYNPNPTADPMPWVMSAFGDLIKAQPTIGVLPNRCGTRYACVTVGDSITDARRISDLRVDSYVRHAYMKSTREETVPRLALNPEVFRIQAAHNTANADINREVGFPGKDDSTYEFFQFYRIVAYLAAHPFKSLQGTIYVDGSFRFLKSVNLGNITLAVGGDLVVDTKASVVIRHDLSTVTGRRTPGIVVLGFRDPVGRRREPCGGQHVDGSGRLVLCGGSTIVVDGLIYTEDGMAIESGGSVDQVGAMYHNNRGTPHPSFINHGGTIVLRFDPLALSAFGKGIAILSWQQLH